MNPEKRAYLELHIAVLLFGFTAILGDLIQLSALVIVWWRVLLTSISLLFLVRVGRLYRSLPRRTIWQFMGIGVLIGLHWIAFYGSVKLSNASICLVCMATTSFFTSFLEPLLLRQRINPLEVGLGLLIIPGMALVVTGTDWSMMPGIVVGLISALLAATFAVLNKKMVHRADPMSITFLELSSAWLFITLLLPVAYFGSSAPLQLQPTWADLGWLLVMALLCTTLAHVLALRALRHISAFAANLTINLEPVYGIALAWFVLNDRQELSPTFYVGVLLILGVVFLYPYLKKQLRQQPAQGPSLK